MIAFYRSASVDNGLLRQFDIADALCNIVGERLTEVKHFLVIPGQRISERLKNPQDSISDTLIPSARLTINTRAGKRSFPSIVSSNSAAFFS